MTRLPGGLLSIEKQSISHTIHGQWHILHRFQFMKSSSLCVNILYLDGLGPGLKELPVLYVFALAFQVHEATVVFP